MRRLAAPAAALTLLAACGTQCSPDSPLDTPLAANQIPRRANETAMPRWERGDEYQPPTTTTTMARASRSARHNPAPTPRAYGVRLLACIRHYEGSYTSISPSGRYRGAYQFDTKTWRGAVTRAGYHEYADVPANEAPPHVQDAAALQLLSERDLQPWPVPSRKCAS